MTRADVVERMQRLVAAMTFGPRPIVPFTMLFSPGSRPVAVALPDFDGFETAKSREPLDAALRVAPVGSIVSLVAEFSSPAGNDRVAILIVCDFDVLAAKANTETWSAPIHQGGHLGAWTKTAVNRQSLQ